MDVQVPHPETPSVFRESPETIIARFYDQWNTPQTCSVGLGVSNLSCYLNGLIADSGGEDVPVDTIRRIMEESAREERINALWSMHNDLKRVVAAMAEVMTKSIPKSADS